MLAIAGPVAYVTNRVPTGLMLPVIVASSDDEPFLRPNDLGAESKAVAH